MDSGFDIDTIRAWSATVSTIGEAPIDVESAPEAQEAVPLIPDAADQAIDAAAEPSGMENENNTSVAAENSMEDSKLESTAMEATSVGMDSGLGVSLNSDLSARMEDSAADLNQTSSSLNDSQRDQIAAETTTLLDESTIIDEAPATKSGADKPVDDQDLVDCDASLRSNSPTESEDSQIDVPVVGSSVNDYFYIFFKHPM